MTTLVRPDGTVAPSGVYVHPAGLCESELVGAGTRIWAFAHVMTGARIGTDCNVGDHAFVESGATVGDRVTIKNQVMIFDRVTVEDDVFLGPGVTFTNDLRPRAATRLGHDELLPTTVRQGASLGARVTVVCGLTIGPGAFVGAGAVVATHVPAHALVVGNPGRIRGWVCSCGERLADDLTCRCGLRYDRAPTGLQPSTA